MWSDVDTPTNLYALYVRWVSMRTNLLGQVQNAESLYQNRTSMP
jgi:hypothetical protein